MLVCWCGRQTIHIGVVDRCEAYNFSIVRNQIIKNQLIFEKQFFLAILFCTVYNLVTYIIKKNFSDGIQQNLQEKKKRRKLTFKYLVKFKRNLPIYWMTARFATCFAQFIFMHSYAPTNNQSKLTTISTDTSIDTNTDLFLFYDHS